MSRRAKIADFRYPLRASSEPIAVRYDNFPPRGSFPVSRTGVNGEATGALFFLFLSAFGFFFSRLLRIWPFAILISLLVGRANWKAASFLSKAA
jgi:hypothetical protein